MPNRNPDAPTIERGVITTDSGLVLPAKPRNIYGGVGQPKKLLANILSQRALDQNVGFKRGYCYGFQLDRDECDLIVRWPVKGGGIDDVLSAAIVDGELANAGIAPTIMPQISALVKRQELQARTADIVLTGRKTPVNAAQDALARANDSPLGSSQFVGQTVYQLRTFNRGAPMATVPITYVHGLWAEEGLEAVPLGKDAYYLEVDWARRRSAIPYLPCVWDLWPSGNPTWPYWFRTEIDGRLSWVLLHCSQVLSITPSSSLYSGPVRNATLGTSTVYLLWSILADHILKVDATTEKIINRVTSGILAISGIDLTPRQIKDEIEAEKATDDIDLMNDYTVLTSEEDIKLDSFSFREDTEEWEQFRIHAENVIALAFDEPLQAVVQRGGLSVHQSDAAAENAADGGVNSILDTIGKALGVIYPRVTVTVSRQNDAAQRLNIETFRDFSEAVRALPEGTLSRDEIRAMIDRDILAIPQTGEDTVTDSANSDQDDPVDSGELGAQLEGMFYQAIYLESVQDAIDSTPFVQLLSLIVNGIQGSYDSVDMPALMDSIAQDETQDEVAQRIADENLMDGAGEHTDLDELFTLMLALASMGINQGNADADAEGVDGLTTDQRGTVVADTSAFIDQRIDELYVAASGGATNDIDDPRLDQTLDDTSRSEVAGAAIRSGTPDEAIAVLAASAANRGALIREVEGLRSHGFGQHRTGRELNAAFKQWLRTTSANPREEHLATVGEIVPYDSAFSNGDTWSQQQIRCACSVRILWSL